MRLVFKTSHGDFTVELYPDEAPGTVENFLRYVDEGFYDGTIFHRVIPDFVIQGGGFTPELERKPTHDPIRNEAGNGLSNEMGTLSMARTSDPHSATSQFFVNLGDNTPLDAGDGYAVFGRVVEGMEVVEAIADLPTGVRGGMRDVPTETAGIQRVERV